MRAVVHGAGRLGRPVPRMLDTHLVRIRLRIRVGVRVLRGDHSGVERGRGRVAHRPLRRRRRLLLHVVARVDRVMLVHVVVLLFGGDLLHDHVALVHIRGRLLLLLLQAGQGGGRVSVVALLRRLGEV